jgi:hypothetical protein
MEEKGMMHFLNNKRESEYIRAGVYKYFPALFVILTIILHACQDKDNTIEYAEGYPNKLAGNWIAYEFQGGAYDLSKLSSEEYNLVTALDPNSSDSLIIDNIYNSGVRVKTHFLGNNFSASHGRQLELINMGQYGIYSVSVDGQFQHDSKEGDYLIMNVGLYDHYSALIDTVFILAFRKTGFEDIDYQSIFDK